MPDLRAVFEKANALQSEFDAAGVGRISDADRAAAECVGELMVEHVFNFPRRYPDGCGAADIAEMVARHVRGAGAGFGPLLADYLEEWARDE